MNEFVQNVHDFVDKKYEQALIKMGNKNCKLVDKIEENRVKYEEELERRAKEEKQLLLAQSLTQSRRRRNVEASKSPGKSRHLKLQNANLAMPGEKCVHREIREDIYTRYYEQFK